jgi:sarcosine oxidase
VLFERFTFGHANGSSAGETRNFRLTYHDPLYVRMARLALERFRELEDEAGVELLRTVGGLDVGDPTDASAAALEEAGERFERPSPEEVAERFPSLRFPEGSRFLFQPDGAVIRSRDVIAAQARLAAAAGADLREGATVTAIAPAADAVQLVTDGDHTVLAAIAIVAAGAWTGPLARSIGLELPLRPTLEQSTHFRSEAGPIPTVIDWAAAPSEPPYIVPNPFEPGQAKAGAHLSGPDVDPDARTFEPDARREAWVLSWAASRLTTPPELLRSETCLYTRTPDEDFVLDAVGPVIVASPCTGHGFKFAPLVGEVLADLATGMTPAIPLERFRVDRPALAAPVR